MPRTPTGNPRGRPQGSGRLTPAQTVAEAQTRLTVRLPTVLYDRLEAFAAGRHFHRRSPQLARCVREALDEYLDRHSNRQTENIPIPEQELVSLPIADLPALPALSLVDRGLLPDCPAVYFVLDETCTVLYVGYTASLRDRWKNHHRLESFRQLEPIRIAWLAVDDAARLSTFEQDFIEQLNPPFNVQRRHGLPTTPLQVQLREAELALIDEVAAQLAQQRYGIPYKRSEALRVAATEGARFLLARQETPTQFSRQPENDTAVQSAALKEAVDTNRQTRNVPQAPGKPTAPQEPVPSAAAHPTPRAPRGAMRQRILALLSAQGEGLSAEEIRAYLKPEKPIGDTLQGMRKAGVVKTRGSGKDMRYCVA
jgi:hypothetical protein